MKGKAMMLLSHEQITAAHERIAPFIRRTPVLTSAFFDALVGARIFFKCENLQEIGAFKMRGAMNAVLCLTNEERTRGVATHSSGNHAQALARAARLTNTKAYIVMPSSAQEIKKAGVRSFGAEIFECEPTHAGRESKLREVVANTGALEVHPFNNENVIAGQATAAAELLEEVPDLNIIVTPVGGGGLISGTALSACYHVKRVSVVGAEPSGADDAYRSLQSGRIEQSQAKSVADGLLSNLGDKTFTVMRELVDRIITVPDDEILAAMRPLLEKLKMLVEPSGAVPLAAVLRERDHFAGKQVGIILSGGNIDVKRFFELTGK